MDIVAPVGPVYQAGTLSGNPIAVTAGLTMLRLIREQGDDLYAQLETNGAKLADGIRREARNEGRTVLVNQVGSMLTVFFTGSAGSHRLHICEKQRYQGICHMVSRDARAGSLLAAEPV